MKRPRRVAVLANVSRRFDRRVVQGVAAYMRERGHWSLYVEEDPLQKLPKLERWDGDGIIADFDDRKIAAAVRGLAIPVIGFGGGRGWYDPACGAHYFTTDNEAIGRLAAQHLLDCGFTRLAFYGNPPRRRARWSEEREQAFSQRAADVLQVVPLSRSTLENRFRANLGRTIHAEIQRVQMERARQLLIHTDLLIKQIAVRCGFKYVPYLTRVFRQHVGFSPGEYRRRNRSGGDTTE